VDARVHGPTLFLLDPDVVELDLGVWEIPSAGVDDEARREPFTTALDRDGKGHLS